MICQCETTDREKIILTVDEDGNLVINMDDGDDEYELEHVGHITDEGIVGRGISRFINTAVVEGCQLTAQYENDMMHIADNLETGNVTFGYKDGIITYSDNTVELSEFIKGYS